MTRREFLAVASGPLLTADFSRPLQGARAAFPVHYRRESAYQSLYSHVLPGNDEFRQEAAAIQIERRLTRVFGGNEPFPPGLEAWKARLGYVRTARFYALPGNVVRYEISTVEGNGSAYHTGLWSLPGFDTVSEESVRAPKPLFRDVTGHVFSGAVSFREQLLQGNPCWRASLDSATGIDVFGNQGIAVGDVDNDGVDEVYVCQPGGLPNRFYKFDSAGQCHDITEQAGLSILDDTTCALFVDLRNSGHQDLVLLLANGPLLFRNQGDGTFREQPEAFQFKTRPQGSFTGMAAADYDRDGRVDIYLCCYVYFQSEDQYQYPAPYHDAQNGPPNFLFRNRLTAEGGSFEDVTEESGINENNNRFSFAPAWCDFDGDGWPDLYVANDFGRNNLYRNREGQFRDEAAKAGVEDIGPGMSASWFDYDGDGKPDLYVSNMWTAAGQRVVRDPAFLPAAKLKEPYRRHTKGNSLYRNRGDGGFDETGPAEGVEMGRWAWGSGAFDFDKDGTPEIFVTTGMVTNPSGEDLNSFFWRQTVAKSPVTQHATPEYENGWNALNQLIRQDYSWCGHEPNVFYVRRDGKYRDSSGISGLDFTDDSRAFAVMDFDGDGNLDLILKSRLGPQVRVMQNNCGAGKPAISIRAKGTKSNADAIGARVEVNGSVQWVQAGSGFLSQHTKVLNFGTGQNAPVTVRIAWPAGSTQEWTGLETGFRYDLTEDETAAVRTAFRTRKELPEKKIIPQNAPVARDAWLLQPVLLPDRQRIQGKGFLLLYEGEKPALRCESIDLAREPEDVAAAYSLLRRYIFEYRSDLELPLLLLLDSQNRVRKLYANPPTEPVMREDLARIDKNRLLALPFPGRYYSEPTRNFFKLGAAFYWAGYPERALPYLEEVVRLKPGNWRALIAIGRIQQENGRPKEALATFQKALVIHPDYAPAMVNAAEACVSANDLSTATAYLKRALELEPQNADAANQMGIVAASSEHFDEAQRWFQQAIASQRDHSGAINNLGVLYAKIGKMNDAIAAFRYGIETTPDDEQLYLNLGRVYISLDRRDQARAVLTQLLEHKPGNAVATKALAELEGR
jgi:tetratricopeptide (TPR) repeat protein